jgi:3-oxoacyl-[acyl-carrier protein] reductase
MFQERLRLDGKVALVIGAGGVGMGINTSVALAEAGASVAGVDWSADGIAAVEERLGGLTGDFHGVVGDVTKAGDVERAVADAIEHFGRIDLLVNLAGGTRPGHWHRADVYPLEAFDEMLALNLRYVFIACQEVVNFSSASALTSAPFHSSYGVAKAAINSLTKTLAVEWAEYGIRVNAVAPGSIRTPKTEAMALDMGSEPIARYLDPDEVAGVVLFLLSDLARGVNGQVVSVDGGASARSPLAELGEWAKVSVPKDFATPFQHTAVEKEQAP